MKRFLMYASCIAALAVAGYAGAATTWSKATTAGPSYNAVLTTSTTPDEGAPSTSVDGFDCEPNKPYLLTVKASYPTQYSYTSFGVRPNDGGILCSSGDASCEAPTKLGGYYADGGCILSAHDGGCVYPQLTDPGTAGDTGVVVAVQSTFRKGELRAYRYNPGSQSWSRAPTFDLFVESGLTEQSFSITAPPAPVGRIAYTPTGMGVPVKIYLTAQSR